MNGGLKFWDGYRHYVSYPLRNLSILHGIHGHAMFRFQVREDEVILLLFAHTRSLEVVPSLFQDLRMETLLVRLLSDIYGGNWEVTILALFDVSAVFDTVDHDIIHKRHSY
jgi:hypothetical protein